MKSFKDFLLTKQSNINEKLDVSTSNKIKNDLKGMWGKELKEILFVSEPTTNKHNVPVIYVMYELAGNKKYDGSIVISEFLIDENEIGLMAAQGAFWDSEPNKGLNKENLIKKLLTKWSKVKFIEVK